MTKKQQEFCRLLREHDVAVTKLVMTLNFGRGEGITANRELDTINRKLFRFIIGRRPAPIELKACRI